MSGGGGFKLNAAGSTDGATIAAGLVGEVISTTVSFASKTPLASGVTLVLTSVTLTPGVWDIESVAAFYTYATTSITKTAICDHTSSSQYYTTSAIEPAIAPGAGTFRALRANRTVSVTVDAVFKLFVLADFTVAGVDTYGAITATRRATA
jgi:hypothetical protein